MNKFQFAEITLNRDLKRSHKNDEQRAEKSSQGTIRAKKTGHGYRVLEKRRPDVDCQIEGCQGGLQQHFLSA